jgi:hypothetical protein
MEAVAFFFVCSPVLVPLMAIGIAHLIDRAETRRVARP